MNNSGVITVGSFSVTSAGSNPQAWAVKMPMFKRYFVSLKITSGTPLAGTTTVYCTPTQGTREQIKSGGVGINIDPTAPESFVIDFPIESLDFSPSGWTANVVMLVTIMAAT